MSSRRRRAHWAVEIQDEILRGIKEIPRLSDVLTASWLGEPIGCLAVDEIEKIRFRPGGKAR